MSTSTRKIVAGLLSIAMVLTLVVGLSATASADTMMSATFTRNLTVGSTGADVTALQTWLATKGFFSVTPTGYFGSITKRAVAQYQASAGITPAVGFFGPITRAYVNVNGNTSGTPVSSVPGCPAGAVYNYLTGSVCAGTPPSTSTTEGTLTVTQSATPANNANVQTNMDVPVYGLDLKAQLADVTISRADLDVSVYTTGPSYDNPGNFVNTIKIWNGSTLVKSWSVGTADFIQGTTSTDYYVRLSNIGFVVPKDTTKTLTVSFSTNGGIDNDRNLVVKGYGSNSLLTMSGNNVNSYYDISSLSRSHVFKKPGTANLTVAADASNPLSQTYRVNTTSNGAPNVTLEAFSAKSDTGASKITSVTVQGQSSTVNGPTALYLWDGSTLIGSQSVSSWVANASSTVTFSNLSLVVPQDTTKTLTITGDFNTSTANGAMASTTVSSVTYQKPNGTSVTTAVNVQGNTQFFYSASPQWSLLSASAVGLNGGNTASSTGITATFVLKAKPLGGSMIVPVAADFNATVASSSSSVALGAASSVTVSGTPTILAEGAEYTVTVVYNVSQSTLAGLPNGSLTSETVTLTQANAVVGGVTVPQIWGLTTFKANPVTFVK